MASFTVFLDCCRGCQRRLVCVRWSCRLLRAVPPRCCPLEASPCRAATPLRSTLRSVRRHLQQRHRRAARPLHCQPTSRSSSRLPLRCRCGPGECLVDCCRFCLSEVCKQLQPSLRGGPPHAVSCLQAHCDESPCKQYPGQAAAGLCIIAAVQVSHGACCLPGIWKH